MLHYKTIIKNQCSRWVVMVHGAGGSIEVWYRQVVDFARHFNILLVDLVGHGGSAKETVGKGFSISTAAEQVIEVVNYLKIEKCHFMGLSLGSIVVRMIAKLNPRQVESMVLAGAVTHLSSKTRLLFRLVRRFRAIIPYRLLRRVMAKNIIPKEQYGESNRLFMKNVKKISFGNFLSWIKVVEELNTHIKRLFDEQTSIPTLYLTGEDDKFFIDEVRQAAYNGGNNVSLIIVPNAGHVCNVDNKSFFNRHSIDFMRNII